ncbi:hypothetical protein [Egbenema bharatensis]
MSGCQVRTGKYLLEKGDRIRILNLNHGESKNQQRKAETQS